MSITKNILTGTSRTWGFDFYQWAELQAADGIASATVSSSPTGPSIGSRTIVDSSNDSNIADAQVNCPITFSTSGTFHVSVQATTTSGAVLAGCVVFIVSDC